MRHCDVVWCHGVTELKAGLLAMRFRSSVFCGRQELLLAFTFKTLYMHRRVYIIPKDRKKQTSTRGFLLKHNPDEPTIHSALERNCFFLLICLVLAVFSSIIFHVYLICFNCTPGISENESMPSKFPWDLSKSWRNLQNSCQQHLYPCLLWAFYPDLRSL